MSKLGSLMSWAGRFAATVVVVSVLPAVGFVTAGTAVAAPGDLAPPCVQHYREKTGTIHVLNNCPDTQRLKLIINYGPDSDCQTRAPGGRYEYFHFSTNLEKVVQC